MKSLGLATFMKYSESLSSLTVAFAFAQVSEWRPGYWVIFLVAAISLLPLLLRTKTEGGVTKAGVMAASDILVFPFFVLRKCFEYLRLWLDPHLPPAFMNSAPTMSLEGELSEIINTRIEQRDVERLIPSFEYDSIRDTLEGNQFLFRNSRRGSRHVARAISEGLRREELLPALYADFRCWQSMRPDIWPLPPPKPSTPLFAQYSYYYCSSINPFRELPFDLFLEILYHLPIPSILSLSSASQVLRTHITETTYLYHVIKTAVLSGTEFWILPVAGVRGEKERAWETIVKWLPSAEASDAPAAESPFLSPSFPYLPFLHAYYASDSMQNRHRLWRIVKQYDVLWRD